MEAQAVGVPTGAAAYGFRWRFPAGLPELMPSGTEDLPDVELCERVREAGHPVPTVTDLAGDEAVLALGGPFSAEVRRTPARVVVVADTAAGEQLVHPILSRPASLLARWHGDEAFHAGAFAVDGGAWGVLGARGAGKSTLMAMLARRGVPVLTDDLLVVRDGRAHVGPRVADLRPEAAERLDALGAGRTTRAGLRHRVALGDSPSSLPLRGWLVLRWGAAGLRRVPGEDALRRIAAERLWNRLDSDGRQVLDLASLPIHDLSRPRDWAQADRAVDALLDGLRG